MSERARERVYERFRQFTSFNKADTSVCTDMNRRIRVVHGVEKRCNLILRVLSNAWHAAKKHKIAHGLTTEEIRMSMLDVPNGNTYTRFDIEYALKKMKKMGIIKSQLGKYPITNRIMWSLVFSPAQLQVKFNEKKSA